MLGEAGWAHVQPASALLLPQQRRNPRVARLRSLNTHYGNTRVYLRVDIHINVAEWLYGRAFPYIFFYLVPYSVFPLLIFTIALYRKLLFFQ